MYIKYMFRLLWGTRRILIGPYGCMAKIYFVSRVKHTTSCCNPILPHHRRVGIHCLFINFYNFLIFNLVLLLLIHGLYMCCDLARSVGSRQHSAEDRLCDLLFFVGMGILKVVTLYVSTDL